MPTTRRFLLTGLLIALSGMLVACGSGDDSKQSTADLAPRLESAKKQIDTAETVDLSMATKEVPSGVTGLLSATGKGNHSPAFEGKVKVVTSGATIGADVIALDGQVYAKTGFAPVFLKIDPASLGAPDPAALFATSGGVSDLLIKTTALKAGDKTRDGDDVLTTITGTLDGATVQSLIPTADAAQTFSVTYKLTDKDQLRAATITGPFYDATATTYTLTLKLLDEPLTVQAP
ncbi:hypothetical protein BH09ACT10_BH09ACT10_01900 [soil metagenome]